MIPATTPRSPTPPRVPVASRSALGSLLLACVLTVALWFVPVASSVLYPLRLFVTFIHEGSHALAATLTGGSAQQIVVQPDASGYTLTAGGWPIIIVMAGYLGATAYGALMLTLARRPKAARAILGVSGTAEAPQFWASSQLLPTTAARAGIELSKDAVLRAMILGLREPTAIQAALRSVGSLAALECLQRLVNSADYDDQVLYWLRYVCTDTNAVAQYLSSASKPSRKLLSWLADAVEPEAVPNDVGHDPWYLALQALAAAEGRLPFELQVYGFRRALGRRSRNVEELLKLTFEPLHAAAESGTFPENQWQLFESSLPWTPFGQEWDAAIRLRRAAARKCSDLQLGAEGLTHLVRSDALFLQLLEEIWGLWGGSRYLRSVSDALERNSHRGRLLKNFIKQHSKLW